MKIVVVAVTLIVAISAQIPTGGYLPSGGNFGSSSGVFDSISTFGGSSSGLTGSGLGVLGGGVSGGFGTGVQDQKHVYFFAAPDEESTSRFRINVIPNSQRNTNIIFVKAPTYGGLIPEVNAPQSLSEERTIVYVLVKRPQDGGQINIPANVGVKTGKPEVYFIKYNTQQDAEQQILYGLQGQKVGSSLSDLGSESTFVKTLGTAAAASGPQGIIASGGQSEGFPSIITTQGTGTETSRVFTSSTGGSAGHFGPVGDSGPY